MQKIPVIAPVKDVKEFSSIDEFNVFYNDHQDEFEELTTCMLNKKYKVPGYRITKIQGVVKLKNVPESRKTALDKVNAAQDRILTIEQKLNSLIKSFNEVVDKSNNAINDVRILRAKIEQMESSPPVIVKEQRFPEPEKEAPAPEKKVKFDDNGPNNMKRSASPRRSGQMMESALAWLQG